MATRFVTIPDLRFCISLNEKNAFDSTYSSYSKTTCSYYLIVNIHGYRMKQNCYEINKQNDINT